MYITLIFHFGIGRDGISKTRFRYRKDGMQQDKSITLSRFIQKLVSREGDT